MEYRILGYDMQHVRVYLGQGESVYGEGGHLVSKEPSVQLKTTAKGGLLSSLERDVTGGGFFVVELSGPGMAEFSSYFPGRVVPIQVSSGLNVEHTSFLFAENSVQYTAKLGKFWAGILGGEGVLLAHFSGQGKVFVHARGGVSTFNLSQGQSVQVEAGHLLAFDDGMNYGIERVGGLKSMLFSGEGLFLVKIDGPGRVWVHNVSVSQFAHTLYRQAPPPTGGGGGQGVTINL
ncbi:transcriptional regulator [Sulfodiicoccus acidiphilus]|uniref:Transcriptional regulator n=1 Tax=Sulfodiicoccus acidiphilus TaxID=1670455 RepID=A0A348B5G3_9CREN|nr:TIGR00266 family protein [Sulfodiicoccus acidiphilus]BBD73415.1 transcriptional regulator [Sulfodiicoccus acidiphilus]GGT98704.1 transcriptional regulator [Sulfodiicoccus acidiphilus]